MAITLVISAEAEDMLLRLSAEDRRQPERLEPLVEALIFEEDRRRHVEIVAFQGEARFQCSRGCACFEHTPRPTAGDELEL